MGRSRESFLKKEVRTKKEKKRKQKEQKRLTRKEEGKKGSLDDMIAYVDEFGRITDTPPDPGQKSVIVAEEIELGIRRREEEPDNTRQGKIRMFDTSKGYGFIQESGSNEQFFLHISDCLDPIRENDLVVFQVEKGLKGLKAVQVKLKK